MSSAVYRRAFCMRGQREALSRSGTDRKLTDAAAVWDARGKSKGLETKS